MTDTLNKTSQSCTGYPTPETDGEWNRIAYYDYPHFEQALAEFARKLERERDEWKAEAERWRSLSEGWQEEAVIRIKESHRLAQGIRAELRKNAHLADGDDCTLIGLKQLIGYEEGDEL